MRTLFLLAIVVVGLIVAGVISIRNSGSTYEITVDKQRWETVKQEAAVVGAELLHQSQAEMEQAARNGQPPQAFGQPQYQQTQYQQYQQPQGYYPPQQQPGFGPPQQYYNQQPQQQYYGPR